MISKTETGNSKLTTGYQRFQFDRFHHQQMDTLQVKWGTVKRLIGS